MNKEFEVVIKEYLDKRASEDELFAKDYAKENKSIKECCRFIMNQARKKFYSEKSKFFDVKAKSGDIEIVTLKSIEEFQKESRALCHCLFHSGYYGRSNSLILSARVKGSITETIEYNLDIKEVAQCQGLQNSKSEHHDKILKVFKSKVVNQILKRIS